MIPALLLSLFGPLPYLLAGYAIMSFCVRRPGDWRLAPLAGCAAMAWITELGLIAGIGGRWTALAALLLAMLVGFFRFPRAWGDIRATLPMFGLLYAVALLAQLFVPFPGMFLWGGDWLETWRTAQAVFANQLGADLLARTPLFGAGSLPLLWLHHQFAAVQVFSIVTAAASILAILPDHAFRDRRSLLWSICLVAGSAFFLLHTSNNWSKLLAAGCVLVSLRTAARSTELRGFIIPAVWFAMSVAAHQSSILFLPLLLVASFQSEELKSRMAVGRLAILACCGVIIAGAFEAWVISRFGLHARVSSNPTVTWRNEVPFLTNTILVAISTCTGWLPLGIAQKIRQAGDLHSASTLAALGFYTLAAWVANLAGTMLGHLLPLWLAAASRLKNALGSFRNYSHPMLLLGALAFAFLGNSLLNPYSAAVGTMQTGLTPFSLLLIYAFLRECGAHSDLPAVRRGAWWTALLGAAPFLAASGSVMLVLQINLPFSTTLRDILQQRDADYRTFTELGLSTLGSVGFPWLHLVVALLTSILIRVVLAATPAAPATTSRSTHSGSSAAINPQAPV